MGPDGGLTLLWDLVRPSAPVGCYWGAIAGPVPLGAPDWLQGLPTAGRYDAASTWVSRDSGGVGGSRFDHWFCQSCTGHGAVGDQPQMPEHHTRVFELRTL